MKHLLSVRVDSTGKALLFVNETPVLELWENAGFVVTRLDVDGVRLRLTAYYFESQITVFLDETLAMWIPLARGCTTYRNEFEVEMATKITVDGYFSL